MIGVCLLFVVLFGESVVYGQVGSNCIYLEQTGICQPLENCRHMIETVINRRPYVRCGFSGFKEIICCPPDEDLVTTTSTVIAPIEDSKIKRRKSEEKCEEYSKAMYETVTVNIGRRVSTEEHDLCGHKTVKLIVGGEYATEREFPHMALLGYGSTGDISWECGGALISDQYVLTAAHCTVTRLHGEVTLVRLGELDYSKTTETAFTEDYPVEQIINHPNYTMSSKYHDIALLRLQSKVKIDPFKRPACLATTFSGPEQRAIATGWGTTEWSGRSSEILQKVTLEFFDYEECKDKYSHEVGPELTDGIRDSEQVCAGSKEGRLDTCQGDSGGPLQVFHQSLYCMYNLVGITSFGAMCGTIGFPGVYTRIYHYLDWIEEVAWGSS